MTQKAQSTRSRVTSPKKLSESHNVACTQPPTAMGECPAEPLCPARSSGRNSRFSQVPRIRGGRKEMPNYAGCSRSSSSSSNKGRSFSRTRSGSDSSRSSRRSSRRSRRRRGSSGRRPRRRSQ